jgi:hypothetical protein
VQEGGGSGEALAYWCVDASLSLAAEPGLLLLLLQLQLLLLPGKLLAACG